MLTAPDWMVFAWSKHLHAVRANPIRAASARATRAAIMNHQCYETEGTETLRYRRDGIRDCIPISKIYAWAEQQCGQVGLDSVLMGVFLDSRARVQFNQNVSQSLLGDESLGQLNEADLG